MADQETQIIINETPTIVSIDADEQVVITTPAEDSVSIITAGEQGPPGQSVKGDKGDKGDSGDVSGVQDARYTHRQEVASEIWTIEHNLGKIPSVTVVDSGDSWVTGAVDYPDLNTVVIEFASEFTGRAYLN